MTDGPPAATATPVTRAAVTVSNPAARMRLRMLVSLATLDAAVPGRVEGLIAPHWLHGERVAAERDVLRVRRPGALVAVLAPLRVEPAVLPRRDVVGIGHGLRVLVAGDDRPAVEDAVAECVRGGVDEVHAAPGRADARPVRVLPGDEGVLDAVRVAEPVDRRGLRVVTAVHRLAGRDRPRRREDDVRRLRVVAEVCRGTDRFGGERVVDEVLAEAERDD